MLLLFLEPAGLELARLFFDVGEFFFYLGQPGAAGGVLFLFQGGALHFELHDLAFELVDLGRHGFELDLQPRPRLVDQILSLIHISEPTRPY